MKFIANIILVGYAHGQTFVHDQLDRLNSTAHSNGTVITYTYDAAGNRLSRAVTAPTPAEIVVEDSSTAPPTDLADSSATLSFSPTAVGQSASRTLTIRNTGQAPLTGLSATFDGAHGAEFAAAGLPATLAGGASAAVTLTFAPAGSGARTAALRIASSDADENPFDIALTGAGELAGHVVTPSASSGGSISPASIQGVPTGGSVTFTATPASGYAVGFWTVNGRAVQAGGTTFALSNITGQQIVMVSFAPTSASAPSAIATGLNGPDALTLDGGDIFFTDNTPSDGIIKRVPTEGGAAAAVTTGAVQYDSGSQRQVEWFQIAGPTIYGGYGGYQTTRIFRVPKSGGTLDVLRTLSGGYFVGVIGSDLYFGSGFSSLMRFSPPSDTDTEVLYGHWIRSSAIDGAAIYFVDYSSRDVKRFDVATSSAATLIPGGASEGSIFLDANNLYHRAGGTLSRVPKTGGTAATILSGTSGNAFVSDDWHLYFVEGGSLKMLPVTGGTAATVTDVPAGFVPSVAVDPARIYWSDTSGGQGAGKIMRINKPAPVMSFADWRSRVLTPAQIANPTLGGFAGQAFIPGVANGIAYFFNMRRPGETTVPQTAGVESVGGVPFLTLAFRQNAAALGLNVVFQVSDDLVSWQSAVPDGVEAMPADPVTGDPVFKVKINVAGRARKFIRMVLAEP